MPRTVTVRSTATATVREVWEVVIPDDTPDDQVEQVATDKFHAGEADFVTQDVSDETDREVSSVES